MRSRLWTAYAICGILAAGCSGGVGVTPPAGGSIPLAPSGVAAPPAYAFAPYVDVTSYPKFQLATYSRTTRNAYFTLAFMQAYRGNQCEAAWGGTALPGSGSSSSSSAAYVAQQLAAIRALGGDGILSFGGAAGTDLADVCLDAQSLANAIEAAIDAYQFTAVDYDIEGNQPYDAASVALRSQALALVEQHYAGLGTTIALSYTLPVLPTGLPPQVLGVVKSALNAGVHLSIVNVMTMDYGNGAAPHPKGRMGAYAIRAAQATLAQLKAIGFPLGSNGYASIGITPMIGQNDTRSEIFEPSDARKLVSWARSNGVGRLSFWAAQRDKACPGGVKRQASDTCSGIKQKPFAFGKIFTRL
ncbi:MAG TPA: chitinase [Candidatus Baltobacteraceae bacterium]|nr:chitinase [Candidatus Baltobacteraceae bacterium]